MQLVQTQSNIRGLEKHSSWESCSLLNRAVANLVFMLTVTVRFRVPTGWRAVGRALLGRPVSPRHQQGKAESNLATCSELSSHLGINCNDPANLAGWGGGRKGEKRLLLFCGMGRC